jgi:hypothetical protein
MAWNPLRTQGKNAQDAIYARYLELQEAEKKRIAEEEERKEILAANPKPPLAPKDAPSGEVSKGIAFGPRRNVTLGKGRKRKIGKTRRNRRLKKK